MPDRAALARLVLTSLGRTNQELARETGMSASWVQRVRAGVIRVGEAGVTPADFKAAQARRLEDTVRECLTCDEPATVLAPRLGISTTTVGRIRRGARFREILPELPRWGRYERQQVYGKAAAAGCSVQTLARQRDCTTCRFYGGGSCTLGFPEARRSVRAGRRCATYWRCS